MSDGAAWKSFTAGVVSASIAWWISTQRSSLSSSIRLKPAYDDNEESIQSNDDGAQVGMYVNGLLGEGLSTSQLIHSHLVQLALSSSNQARPIIKSLWDLIRNNSIQLGDFPAQKRIRWPWESLRKQYNNDDDFTQQIQDGESKLKAYSRGESSFPLHAHGHGQEGRIIDDSNDGTTNSIESRQNGNGQTYQKTGLCIGNIYGLDVGGSLAKLVYFEQKRNLHQPSKSPSFETEVQTLGQNRSHSVCDNLDKLALDDDYDYDSQHLKISGSKSEASSPNRETKDEDEHVKQKRKRSVSMVDLYSLSAKRAQALDSFYSLARKLDMYETGVKEKNLSFYSKSLGGEFHFIQFETRHMNLAMDLIQSYNLHVNIVKMGATGGGAHKYAEKWEQMLGIKMAKQNELDSLVVGMQFLLEDNVAGECYALTNEEELSSSHTSSIDATTKTGSSPYQKSNDQVEQTGNSVDSTAKSTTNKNSDIRWWSRKVQRKVVTSDYPYLVVMIGTGVSVLRVDGMRKHERISGSTIGGGTYWGLCRLLTDVEDFESVLSLAEQGDPCKVDMMVGDIYGENSNALDKLGLTTDVVASSFGKLVAKQDPAEGLKQEDLARALLLMVTNNIGQVAYLNAQLHNTKRIFFVGNFLRDNALSQRRLAYAINYWSRGKMEALFLEHEGYFGALGAFLLNLESSSKETGNSNIQEV